jgi:monovalent cation/proton antiporter MnhG/PhaG subunit
VDVSAGWILQAALLAFAALSAALTAIGVLTGKDSYERLQFMGPAATLGVWAVAAAVLIQEGLDEAGAKAVLIAVVISLMNAVLSHATARAVYMPQQEDSRRRNGGD